MPSPIGLLDLETSRDVADLAREIFGAEPGDSGVVQPAAVWRSGERLRSLVIEEETPKSDLDAFSLNLTRAWADAIVTTGQILRQEPELTHDLGGPQGVPQALARWRHNRLGKRLPPTSLVLTRGKDLDLNHPFFEATDRVLIFTTERGHDRLASAAAEKGIEVVARQEPGIRAAIRLLKRRGAKVISVEAGPSSSRELYRAPLIVTELFLSVYGALTLPKRLQGGDLPPLQQLSAQFPGVSGFYPGEDAWSFYRYFR